MHLPTHEEITEYHRHSDVRDGEVDWEAVETINQVVAPDVFEDEWTVINCDEDPMTKVVMLKGRLALQRRTYG